MSDFKFTESVYEEAFLDHLRQEHYEYSCGYEIFRAPEELLLKDDFNAYLQKEYPNLDFSPEEVDDLMRNIRRMNGLGVYQQMKERLSLLRKGFSYKRKAGSQETLVFRYLDFEDSEKNVFRAVNQLPVHEVDSRRPDIVIFVNGIPVSVIELKNPADENVDIYDAYLQLHNRYSLKIPALMSYSLLSVISDGANTRVGALFADYEHFFSWNSVDGRSFVKDGIASLYSCVHGLFKHETLLNVIKDFIYFPDTSLEEKMVVPKYSQYYGARALFFNIKDHLKPNGDGKGGTYFGATGCGKSYTMLFLTRLLVTSSWFKNPTVILLTDRTDLDDQLSEIFESSKDFLIDKNTLEIASRKVLLEKVSGVTSGGVFLLTIQKFREGVNLLSDRDNIICISDEAHRTQLNLDQALKIDSEGAHTHHGFAFYLKRSFPNATRVGFTGTPIDETINVFGPIASKYGILQSVSDKSTVGITVLPGPRSVRVDEAKLALVDKFYEEKLHGGANAHQVEQSKKEMAQVRTIIANDDRLNKIIDHFLAHYDKRISDKATVCGKAMFVCYDRDIAFTVYKKILEKRPEWGLPKKSSEDISGLSDKEKEKLTEVPFVNLIATNGENDSKELSLALQDDAYRKRMAKLFKNPKSNFKIAILVDMWITGFDVECLDTMYLDKPVERHSLIQTISRVNRVFEGKENGLIVDYIGFEAALAEAWKKYGFEGGEGGSQNEDQALGFFKDYLSAVSNIMSAFDDGKFFGGTPAEKLDCINKAVEYVQKERTIENRFCDLVQKLKAAYDVCVGDERISEIEIGKVHFYCAIKSVLFKISGDPTSDVVSMNNEVQKLVDQCIKAVNGEKEGPVSTLNLFSQDYLQQIEALPYPNTKFQLLIKLLRRAIRQYSKTNQVKAVDFSKKMKQIVDKYNSRDTIITMADSKVAGQFLDDLTEQAQHLLEDLQSDASSFSKLGITFEEKSFYDILKSIRDNSKQHFEYPDDKLIYLAKEIKRLVDEKANYVDWSSRTRIRNAFKSDLTRLLASNHFPPWTWSEAYDKVFEQTENFIKYENDD